jgi:hypothetical protein
MNKKGYLYALGFVNKESEHKAEYEVASYEKKFID